LLKEADPADDLAMEKALKRIPDGPRAKAAWFGERGFKAWWGKRNRPDMVKQLIQDGSSLKKSCGLTRNEVLNHLDAFQKWLTVGEPWLPGKPLRDAKSAKRYVEAVRELMKVADPSDPVSIEKAIVEKRVSTDVEWAWKADHRHGFLYWWELRGRGKVAVPAVDVGLLTKVLAVPESPKGRFLVTDKTVVGDPPVAHRTLPVVATGYDPWEWKAALVDLARELDHRGLTSTELEQMSPKAVADLIRVPFKCGTTRVDPELLSLARNVRYMELGQITPSAVDELLRKLK
jgi:hypothetical protein